MKFTLNRPLLKKLGMGLAGLLIVVILFVWLALPGIIQSQAEQFITEKTGHRLTLDRPEIHPFALSVRLSNLKLADTDGKPLFSFDALLVDVAAASLTSRALVFDAIRLDGPDITVIEQVSGALNWTPFLDAFKSKEAAPAPTALPRLDIRSLAVIAGKVDFSDQRSTGNGFKTQIEPLEINLTDVSTFPDDSGKFSLEANTSLGARVALAGEVALNPFTIKGTVKLDGLNLAQLAPYLKDALPAAPAGVATLAANYRAGNHGDRLDVSIDGLEATLTGLRVPLDREAGVGIGKVALKEVKFDLSSKVLGIGPVTIDDVRLELPKIERSLHLAAITLDSARIDLQQQQAALGTLRLAQGSLFAARDAGGRIYLVDALNALATNRQTKAPAAAPAPAAGKPWHFKLDTLAIDDLAIEMREEGVSPPAVLKLDRLALQVSNISDDLKQSLPVKLGFDVASGGRFEAAGSYAPADMAADFKVKLSDLSLKPAQPFLTAKTTLTLADGSFSTEGQMRYNAKGPDYRGEFALRNLRLAETDGETLLGWKALSGERIALTADKLDIGELRLNALDTKLIIAKDKSLNFARVMKPAPVDTVAAAEAVPPPSTFAVNVSRVRFYNGAMFFADHSLVLPFGTRIHGLRGSVSNLSSRPGGGHGQVELEGEVDEYGMARAAGQLDLFNPTGFMDLRVLFKNVDMPRLTPYTATFAGRKIDSGKLTLDLQYKIKERQLQGENQVIIERLTLGERVESPGAADLPLDLAIAILQDSDGRIDLGLPVSGNLDDPQFSYGAIVWQAVRNVLTKIVTAPFRALASLFGGSGEKVDTIAYEAGMSQLTPPEREKLVRLAEAMTKRPGLQLVVSGTYAESDRVALQDMQLRRTVLKLMGERVNEKYDPGPLSTSQPKARSVLEDLYGERFGGSDLAALKEGFRQANPGQLEEGAAGRVMSRLSGLLREKKTLSASEVDQLKGADFHGLLFERLRAKEALGDAQLVDLAKARAEFAVQTLKAAGQTGERVQVQAAEKVETEAAGVPLKLSLEAVRKD